MIKAFKRSEEENMNEKIFKIIISVIDEYNEQLSKKIPINIGTETPLYGENGLLDSLALVSLIVMIEQSLEDELDVILTLADEKAMSLKYNPFENIGTLMEYIEKRMKDEIE